MSEFLMQMSNLPRRLNAARRVSIYNQLQPLVDARGMSRASAHIDRARVHDAETRELETRWDAQGATGKYGEVLHALDPRADRLLVNLHQVGSAYAEAVADDESLAARIRDMLDEVFPAGPGAITKLPFVDQALAMDNCVAKLSGRFASVVADIGMTPLLDRLTEVARSYRAEVDAGRSRVDYDEVRAASRRGHLYMLEIIAMLTSEFNDSDDPLHLRARAELFTPIADNLAAVKAENRARRTRASNAEPDAEPDADAEPGADADAGAVAGAVAG